MSDNPSFVRLAVRLQKGMICDVHGSGWAISGLDVLPYPKDLAAARYVRAELQAGKLEPASRAEYDEVQEGNDAIAKEVKRQNPDFGKGHQEAALNDVSGAASRKLAEARGVDPDAEFEAALEADNEDRAARLAEQEEAGLNTDDPEEQKARTAGSVKKKKKNSNKSKKEDSEKE